MSAHRPPPLISVVVVTCDRAGGLDLLFSALERQTANGRIGWELVMVDNGSRDSTTSTIRGFAGRSGFDVTYVFEPRKGKSRGLNAGLARARGSIIAFTDDDGIPAPDWLELIAGHFEHEPQICVGGRVELHDPADALISVRTSREAQVVGASNFTAGNIPVIGCNMAIDGATLRRLGPFDVCFGPGSRVGSAEDTDMLYRIVRAGHSVRYDPRLVVFHNHGRRTDTAVDRVVTRYLAGRGGFYCKYILAHDRAALRWAYWEARALVSECIRGGFVSTSSRRSLRQLAWLLRGAARYLRCGPPAGPRALATSGTRDT